MSYSHLDSFWMRKLLAILSFPDVDVMPWSDMNIVPGKPWDEEIKNELAEMDVFIPLLSVHFAVSNYINEVECEIAKERYSNGEIEVVPVLVHNPGMGECGWLMALQRLPPGDQSWAEMVRDFREHDMALTLIRDGIREAVKRAQSRKHP